MTAHEKEQNGELPGSPFCISFAFCIAGWSLLARVGWCTSQQNEDNPWFSHRPMQNEVAMNSLPQNGTYLLPSLIVAAAFLFVAIVVVHRLFALFKVRNTPLTPSDVLRKYASQTQPSESVQSRLTSGGYVLVIFAVVFGLLWAGVTFATLHKFVVDERFAKTGQTITATVLSTSSSRHGHIVRYEFQVDGQAYRGAAYVQTLRSLANARKSKGIEVTYLPSDPATNRAAEEKNLPIFIGLLPVAMLALFFVMFASQLRRDFVLARDGRLTTGIAVGVVPGLKHSTWIHYDFLNDRGGVTRGKSSLSVLYSSNVAVGSSVEVVYLPDSPERNALKQSLRWQA
jgi:hypothetical protein